MVSLPVCLSEGAVREHVQGPSSPHSVPTNSAEWMVPGPLAGGSASEAAEWDLNLDSSALLAI